MFKSQGYPKMDGFFLENPMKTWMIWGFSTPLFLETPHMFNSQGLALR